MIIRKLILSATLVATTLAPLAYAAPVPGDKSRSGADDVVVDERTEQMIKGGLKYLASRQQPNGSWAEGDRNHAGAITAYVLLAFLSTGNMPNEGEHGQVVQRGVDFLINCARPDGYIAAADGAHNMYGHGIATLALGELYGMTNDEAIRPRLERAIKLIIGAQNKDGGWRYNPRPGDADVSVSVLQVVALRVAKNSGIDVPEETLDRAVKYIRACHHDSGGFTYQSKGGGPGSARTAAAVYALQVCGLYDDKMVEAGNAYYLNNYQRDRSYFTYGINYAGPVNYMVGGETWRKFYGEIKARIIKDAKSQGALFYWAAQGPGGESYATAVSVGVLAMPYGYLPLYQR
jgi:prenyltransferase beta subunit